MNSSNPITLKDWQKERRPLRNINIEQREKLTRLEKFAVWITEKVGSMHFFLFILLWTILWFSWNIFGPEDLHFDPFPAFVLWLFISNVLQLILLPLLMIGQNLQGRHSEARAEADYEVNKKSEEELESLFNYLDEQNKLISEIKDTLENKK